MDGPAKKLDELVRAHLPQTLQFAIRLTGSLDAAEDVVGDALVRVSRSWKFFRGEAEFRTWLFRIVINAFRDSIKHRPSAASLPDHLPDHRSREPFTEAATAELGRLIAAKVSNLPPRQREVLVLVAYEGLNPREVAQLLGIGESNVHATLHVARERLRSELMPYLAEK